MSVDTWNFRILYNNETTCGSYKKTLEHMRAGWMFCKTTHFCSKVNRKNSLVIRGAVKPQRGATNRDADMDITYRHRWFISDKHWTRLIYINMILCEYLYMLLMNLREFDWNTWANLIWSNSELLLQCDRETYTAIIGCTAFLSALTVSIQLLLHWPETFQIFQTQACG